MNSPRMLFGEFLQKNDGIIKRYDNIHIIKIRSRRDSLIFLTGIPILGTEHTYTDFDVRYLSGRSVIWFKVNSSCRGHTVKDAIFSSYLNRFNRKVMICYYFMLNMPHNIIVVHQGKRYIGMDSQIDIVSHVTGQIICSTLALFSPELLTYIYQITEVIIWLTLFGDFSETDVN